MARVWRRVVSVPVLAVLLLISFVYYSTFFFPNPNPNPFIFSFLALMSLLSFLVSVLVDPGHVSTDLENPNPTKSDMQTKYCDRCCIHKPSRTHHCRVCKRCVLKMDHHCLWINNCVGYRNYKPFFIFLVYSTIALVYATVIFLYNVFHTDGHFGPYLRLFYVISGTVDISMSLILGTLLGWHVYLLSRNLTTIEHRGEVRAIWLAKKSGHVYRHPFNLGFRNNVTSVLGPNVLTWFWPVALGHLKDGTNFPIYHD